MYYAILLGAENMAATDRVEEFEDQEEATGFAATENEIYASSYESADAYDNDPLALEWIVASSEEFERDHPDLVSDE